MRSGTAILRKWVLNENWNARWELEVIHAWGRGQSQWAVENREVAFSEQRGRPIRVQRERQIRSASRSTSINGRLCCC